MGAKRASLGVFAGGEEAVFRKAEPALAAIGDKVSYVGPIGSGTIAKLVHNQVALCTSAVLAEAFTMGVKAGVSPEALFKAVSDGAFGQGHSSHAAPGDLQGWVWPRFFPLKLARKDLGLATEVAREFNVPMALAALVEQDMMAGLEGGLGEQDATVAFTIQEASSGVKVRSS